MMKSAGEALAWLIAVVTTNLSNDLDASLNLSTFSVSVSVKPLPALWCSWLTKIVLYRIFKSPVPSGQAVTRVRFTKVQS